MDHPLAQGSESAALGLSAHRSRKRWVRLAVSLSLGIALMVVVYLIFIGLAALHVSHGFWSGGLWRSCVPTQLVGELSLYPS